MSDFITSGDKTKQLYNDAYSNHYRNYDEQYFGTPDHQHYTQRLNSITQTFPNRISVLDIGCGTGRYFHALKNVAELTGIDISINMLNEAKNPVKRTMIDIEKIELVEGNVFEYDFGTQKFDFIYSIGVLGEHAPITVELCNKICSLLNDKGVFYTTINDLQTRKSFKRKLADIAYHFMPANIKRKLDERWKTNYMTRKQVEKLMAATTFSKYEIHTFKSQDKAWKGMHYECIEYK